MKKLPKNTYAGKPINLGANAGFKKNKRKQLKQFAQ
jgi:hypothetical protein